MRSTLQNWPINGLNGLRRYKNDPGSLFAADIEVTVRLGLWWAGLSCRWRTLAWRKLSEVTLILERIDRGDPGAAQELLPMVYAELRRIAAAKLQLESAQVTLQPTALVHEAWLRLGGDEQGAWSDRRHFVGAAAEAMRRILIERARRRQAVRHGGGLARVDFTHAEQVAPEPIDERILALAEALDRLAALSPERAELVKLRYFAGLTLEQVAETLGISLATAKRQWTFARAWLLAEMERAG